jgi:hypothetical protein
MVIIDLILLVAFLSGKCKSSFQVPAHIHKSARFRRWTKSCHGGLRFISSPSIVDRFTFHPINRPIKAIIQPKKLYSTASSSCIAYQPFFFWVWTSEVQRVIEPRTHPSSSTVVTRSPSSYVAVRLSLSIRPACVPASGVCVCADVYPGSIPVAPPKSPWQDKRSRKEHSATERSRHKSRQSSAPNPSAESHISK